MPIETINIVGAGGQAAVVIDALLRAGVARAQIAVWSETAGDIGRDVLGGTTCRLDVLGLKSQSFHICIGDNITRARLYRMLEAEGGIPRTVVHPDASVSEFAALGPGVFVAARAVIAPRTRLGTATIVNHGAVVDHDCIVGEFCHIAPGSTLAGGVQLGIGVLIGAGANLLPRVLVGDRSIVGAGAVVLNEVPPEAVFAGVPAERLVRE